MKIIIEVAKLFFVKRFNRINKSPRLFGQAELILINKKHLLAAIVPLII